MGCFVRETVSDGLILDAQRFVIEFRHGKGVMEEVAIVCSVEEKRCIVGVVLSQHVLHHPDGSDGGGECEGEAVLQGEIEGEVGERLGIEGRKRVSLLAVGIDGKEGCFACLLPVAMVMVDDGEVVVGLRQ